jgi:hypothetical protein
MTSPICVPTWFVNARNKQTQVERAPVYFIALSPVPSALPPAILRGAPPRVFLTTHVMAEASGQFPG